MELLTALLTQPIHISAGLFIGVKLDQLFEGKVISDEVDVLLQALSTAIIVAFYAEYIPWTDLSGGVLFQFLLMYMQKNFLKKIDTLYLKYSQPEINESL